jgi:hypothetical protein
MAVGYSRSDKRSGETAETKALQMESAIKNI